MLNYKYNIFNSSQFIKNVSTVDAGCRGVIFDRFQGVKDKVHGEGTHFLIPFIQKPIIFDCKARPRNVPVVTGSKGTLVLCFSNLSFILDKNTSKIYYVYNV